MDEGPQAAGVGARAGVGYFTPATMTALVLVIVYALAGAIATSPPGRRPLLAGVGAAYLVLAAVVMPRAARRSGARPSRALLALALALGLTLMALGRGGGVLATLPMVSVTVLEVSTAAALVLASLVAALEWALLLHAGFPPPVAWQAGGGYLVVAAFVVAFSRLAEREQQLRRRAEEQAAQIEELVEVRERGRIARDIHDSVGHCLTVVNVQIGAARTLIGDGDRDGAGACLDQAQRLVREGLGEVRQAVSVLRAGPLGGRPFAVALAALLDYARSDGLAVTLEVTGAPRPLAPAVEFVLYRVAQEALTNVRRHAGASAARLALVYGDGRVGLRVRDDGAGAVSTDGGFGLRGVRERVAQLGGAVTVTTAPEDGFTLAVELPA